MNGYIGRENFDRFKIKTEFVNPLFPFKSADQTEKMSWNGLRRTSLNKRLLVCSGL